MTDANVETTTKTTPTADAPVLDPGPPPAYTSPPLPATTTAQEDETTAGQRRINLIWEWTQAIIAIVVVMTTMGIGAYTVIKEVQFPTIVSVAFGTIIGFYFARTNHQAIGGVGAKPNETQDYKGR